MGSFIIAMKKMTRHPAAVEPIVVSSSSMRDLKNGLL